MNTVITLLNGIAVSVFGTVLSWYFCGKPDTSKKKWLLIISTILLLVVQGIMYLVFPFYTLQYIYPITLHIPLFFVLWYFTGKPLWTAGSILMAYLCCQLRRYIAILLVSFFENGMQYQSLVEVTITIPILFLLVQFVAPFVRELLDQSYSRQLHFCVIPFVYYIYDYIASVYTDFLAMGMPVVIEFMSFVCSASYLIFLSYHSRKEKNQLTLEQVNHILDIQLSQSVREIDSLRQSQTLAVQYRHDMRHHLQYLSSCLDEGKIQQVKEYISTICQNIESQKIRQFCENEAANLILSSFSGRAKKDGVSMLVTGDLPKELHVSELDLCVLLSNALENALHACASVVSSKQQAEIKVMCYVKNERLFIQILNSTDGNIRFQDGNPVSAVPGHGVGVQSICAIVHKYNGLCSFDIEGDNFIFRASL